MYGDSIIQNILNRLDNVEEKIKKYEATEKQKIDSIQVIKPIKDFTKVRTFRISVDTENKLDELHKNKFHNFNFQDLVNTALIEFVEKNK